MDIKFLGQPYENYTSLVNFINEATKNGNTELKIAVAWAKRSGLGRIWDALQDFRNAGGYITLIVGVSEGGASKEGLELAAQIADESYIFHDPQRTFHPKVYFASSHDTNSLLVGSSNLTAGGLGWNYESSLWINWGNKENNDLQKAVLAWFNQLISQEGSCRTLNVDLIERIEKSPDIFLINEGKSSRVDPLKTKNKSTPPEDNDSAVISAVEGIFKTVEPSKITKLPPLSSELDIFKGLSSRGEHNVNISVSLPDEDNIQYRWFRKLDNTAAQQVRSPKSNPTGNLRLTQGEFNIDHKVYFRNCFFDKLPWHSNNKKPDEQEVYIAFHVWFADSYLGEKYLRISHYARRIADQGNVPTVLHWGEIGQKLREHNYVGKYITLERTLDSEFHLIISDMPRGSCHV